jgi:hypothetical protein
MKTQIIQLERHDDLTVVVDKVTWSKADRVLLVWPPRGEVLTRPLDLVLVQRACQGLGVPLACVADDPDVLDHALELGIPVFRSAKIAQRLPWRRRRRKKVLEKRPMQPRASLEEQRSAGQMPGFAWLQRPAARMAFFILGVFSVLGLMLFLFPEANIDLSLAKSEQSLDLQVWASPEIASMNLTGGIPARVVSVVVEGQASQPTTGSLSLPEKTASGRIQFSNLTNQAVTVPAGTLIQTLRDPVVRYQTTQKVTLLPAVGSLAEAPVEALQAGSQSNVFARQLQAVIGDLGLKVSATNLDAISNGRDGINRTASPADWETLRGRLLDTLQSGARRELDQKLEPGSRLIASTLSLSKVVLEKQEPPAGTPADQVTLTLQVEYTAWTYQVADIERLTLTVLETNLPAEKMIIPGSFQVQSLSEPRLSEGQARWQVRARQQLQQAWNDRPAVRAVTGQLPAAASQNLAALYDLTGPAQIQLNPAWWPLMPLLPGRIQVNLQ